MKKLIIKIDENGNSTAEYQEMLEVEEYHELNWIREKRLHDEDFALGSARREGAIEERNSLIEKWRKKGKTEEEIRELLED